MHCVSTAPTPPLAEFIERLWYSSDAPSHQKVQIVPSGTMELVFNLDEDELGIYDSEQPGSYKSFSGAFFSGAYARPLFVDTREHVLGVHFKPGGAFRFLGVPASELADIHVDLEALWGKSTQDLREQLCAAANPAKRFRVLERALVARLENSLEEHRAVRAALAAAALFGGLVYVVLVAAHVSQPAATTVYGLTPRRLWATTVAVLALAGVVIGGLALARPASRFGTASGRLGAIVAVMAGLIAVINGGLNLAIANGGPGTGNGVVGGAVAVVLGLIGTVLGGLALARSRRSRSTG